MQSTYSLRPALEMTNRFTPWNANRPIGVRAATRKTDQPRHDPLWHSRGYLPHFEGPSAVQHVTFHLADSLPSEALNRLAAEISQLPPDQQRAERWKRPQALIDAGHGSCLLRTPAYAQAMKETLCRFDPTRYRLFAWVVMPNHVHALLAPANGWTVAKIVATWKKFTGRRFNDLTGLPPSPVWQREYWDRFMRNEKHFRETVAYINENPVRAGLVASARDWPWSSAAEIANRAIGAPRLEGTRSPQAP